MSDKDQFTFEDDDDFPETNLGNKDEPQGLDVSYDNDSPEINLGSKDEPQELDLSYNDDFPETDLSAAFSEGEHSAEESTLNKPEEQFKGGGNSRTRTLLMVLLLVIAGGAGAYYFMGLEGSTPSVPTVQVPAQKTTKSVALPSQPAEAPAKVEPVAAPVTVAVPLPPSTPPVEAVKVAPVEKPVVVTTTQAAPVATSAEKVPAEKPAMEAAKQPAAQVSVPVPQAKPTPAPAPAVPQKAAVSVPSEPMSAESTKVAVAPKQVVGGAFALDAGSYLLESNRESLVAKIKELGYEPLVTPVDATLNMTRLRLGTFGKDEVQEALDFARSIEPGAYSAPAGDGYVVYAGTFLKSSNIDRLSRRFLEEGIKAHPEPVQVVRTLSRIRFGSFATKEEAAAAAQEVKRAGLKTTVVKSK